MHKGNVLEVRGFLAATVFAVAAISLLVLQAQLVNAAVTTNAVTSLTRVNQTIKASSTPVAVLGINLAGNSSEAVGSTTIAFIFSSSGTTTDIAALGTATSSGVALYRDDASSGTQGTFDAADDVVPLSADPVWDASGTSATTTLLFTAAEVVLANDTGDNAGDDYFVVIQSTSSPVNGHAFLAQMIPGNVGWNIGAHAGPLATQTNVITVDTVAPTVDTTRTGPMNGSTGVPVSTFIHMGFSENLDQTTLNPGNITFTQGGTAVGAAIRPFPDGFDVISSSPPTYTAGSKFAKVTTASTAFFNIFGTTTIFAQGAYTAPSYGDIVYTQSDTFPPEVGLVTNNTMVGGTFAINGFSLFRASQITKFATPAFATTTATLSALGVGDLVVTKTATNPTDLRYSWHIVTTGGGVASTDIRYDNGSAAPTYPASTTLSRILATATTTTDTSGRLIATTTFATSSLVFAKVATGADNTGSYAWHLITQGETINTPTGPGTTTSSFLRLDSANAAPHFVPSSVIAVLSTAGGGPVDSGAQDATVFSMGDLQFSKATAGASNLDSYNFHLVSNGATGATSTALRLDNASANLTPSTIYVVTAGPGIKDSAGNNFAASSTLTFTTGSTGATNVTPPAVQSTQPQSGSQTFPLGSPIKLTFSVAMKSDGGANAVTNSAVVKLSTDVNGTPTTAVTATNTYDSTTNPVTITPAANLATSTAYVVQVLTTAQSTTNTPMPMEYRLYFRTGSAADTTAPTVLGVNPSSGQTGIPLSQVFTAGFSEDMNPATLTSSTITLTAQIGGAATAGNINYSPQSRSASFAPSTALSANTGYKLTIISGGSGVKDLSNNALAANYIAYATTTATADTTAPTVSFASADNFGIAISFSETMVTGGGPNAADNVANYTLESPTGTSMSLGGKTVTYDAMTRTARISGLSLTNGNSFKVTVATPVQDLSSNSISTAGSPAGNLAFGTVQNSSTTGGQLGPGSGTIDQGMQGMNPTRVTPMTRAAGAPSNYKVEFLAGTSIPSGGQIVLTFPTGFDFTNVDDVAAASSFCNADLNGPMTGAPTIGAVVGDNSAGSVTITTATAATGANSFVCLDLTGIVNSTVPSSAGYQVDVKTRDTAANNRAILETKTASPFFLGQSGSLNLTVNVFNDGNANSSIDASEGIASVRVFLFSPAIGGNSTSTNASGVASFLSLAAGDYMIGIDPGSLAAASSTVSINSAPQPFTVSATNLTKNFIVSGGGSTIAIAGNITGPSGTSVDVFAGSPSGFSKQTLTLTAGPDDYSLRVSPNQTYNVSVGPAMPEAFFTPGAPPPPPPTFTFMPPPPLSVTVATTSVTGKNFTLSAANKTIAGSVLDSGGNGVSNAGVFARPLGNSTVGGTEVGFGTGGQTNTSGAFSLSVVPGVYLVGVFKPGMPHVSEQQITVPTTGANTPSSLSFKLDAATTLTISGTVKDDSGNAVPYAGVGGRKVVSTSDTTPVGGNSGNFVGGPTDANGAYTLYVDAGTWVIEAFAPGFGRLGTKTVTVTTSSLSGQDFDAQTLSLGTITGTTTKDSVLQQGVMVRAEGANGANMGVSDASGVYTLKVPAGTYTVHCAFPGVGEGTPVENITVTANATTYNNNCALAAPITITVQITDGTNAITGAFVDVQNSSGRGNGTNVSATSTIYGVYTVNVPPGTYTVRAGHPAYGMIGSTGSVSSTQTITYTTSAGALNAVTGTIIADGSGVNGAWVSIFGTPTGQTNTVQIGGQTDANGAFSINVPAGSYRLRVNKPGYVSPPASTLNVTGATSVGTLGISATGQTITGTVTLDSSPISGAFVDAASGSDGFAVAQTDSAGAYSLPVGNGSWTLRAHSIGYEGGPTTVTVSNNNPSNQTITLSAISGFTIRPEKQESVTPTAGGMLTNSDIGSAFKLNIPANALGSGSNSATVKTQTNSAVPNTVNGTVLSKNAVTITAVDSSGQPVKNLNDDATIVIPYSESDIPSGNSETDLQIGVWNDATQSYDMLSTTVDTTNNTLTAVVSHFSDFAPIATGATQATAVAAAAPAAAAAAASGGGGGGGVIGGGGATTPQGRAQIVYPDGRVVYVDQMSGESPEAAAAIRAQNTVSAGAPAASASASAKFTALLKQGSRGADVSRLQKLLGLTATGYFGAQTRAALEKFQISYGVAKKGQAGFGTLGPKTRAKIGEVFGVGVAAPSASAQGEAQSGNASVSATGALARSLNLRAKGDDVIILQIILNTDPDTAVAKSGAGSAGAETNLFGNATLRAVKKFQVKYGLAKSGDIGYGNVGPKTRAKLNALLTELRKPATPVTPASPATPATPGTSETPATPATPATGAATTSSGAGETSMGAASATTTAEVAVAATTTATTTTGTGY